MKRTLGVAGVGALALIAVACGGGSKANPTKASSKSTQTTVARGSANPNTPEVSPTGDIPDNQAYVVYAPPSAGFSVKVPEGWARSAEGGAVVFTDKLNSIRTETAAAASAPTVATAEQALPAIRAAVKNLDRAQVTAVTRKAGNAVLITYGADSNPDAVTGKVRRLDVQRYEFWRNGTQVILTLTAPQGSDNVDPWRIVTDSFGWL